ncbi:MAG: hypothetical protein GXO29_03265 [Thermotogae bacterium]|nr:hypothetical protein [Thermotogota bacterium]
MNRQVENLLKQLVKRNPQIKAVAVVNFEGILISSLSLQGANESSFGAMSAALLGLGEHALREIQGGELREIYVRGEEMMLVIVGIGDVGVIAITVDADAPLGVILMEVRRTANALNKVLSQKQDLSDILGSDLSILEEFSFKDIIGEEE